MNVTIAWYVFLLGVSFVGAQSLSQEIKTDTQGWTTTIDAGMDAVSTLLLNPATGNGNSRLGFGAALSIDTQYNSGKFSWSTESDAEFGIQKTGSGRLAEYPEEKVPFEKNVDRVRLHSKATLRTSYFSNFYYGAELFFSSQLTPTYEENYMKDITQRGNPISEFFSPAVLQFSLGMEYHPNDYVSVFVSPIALKSNIVLNNAIANDFATNAEGEVLGSVHGNPLEVQDDGTILYDTALYQLGAAFRLTYKNTIVHDRLEINTNLSLFADYLDRIDHIDVNWRNEIDFTIVKGIQISLQGVLTYDHDVFVQISDADSPKGIRLNANDGNPVFGRRVSYAQQLVLKYTYTFE